MSVEITPSVHQSIIDQINSSFEGYTIVAYDNEHTPFQVVFLVLRNVVPLSDEESFKITNEIHTLGKSIVYKGDKDHCYKIGEALGKINVQYEIYAS